MKNNPDFIIENGVLSKYTGPGGDVVIPEGVTGIGYEAFQWSGLTSISLPDSVTDVDFGAFSYCTALSNVTLHASAAALYAKQNNIKLEAID